MLWACLGCHNDVPIPATGEARVAVDAVPGAYSVAWDGLDEVRLVHARPRILLDGRWISAEHYSNSEVYIESRPDGTVIQSLLFSGTPDLPDLSTEIRSTPGESALFIRTRAVNRTDLTFDLAGFEPISVTADEGGRAYVGSCPDDHVLLISGHSSWTFSGALDLRPGSIGRGPLGLSVPDDLLFPLSNYLFDVAGAVRYVLLGLARTGGISSWYAAAMDPGSGSSLFAGACSAERWKTTVVLEHDPAVSLPGGSNGRPLTALRVVCGASGDHVPLAPGEEDESETVYLEAGPDPFRLLDAYALEVRRRTGGGPNRPAADVMQLGWSSWSAFFSSISEEVVLGQARLMAEHLAPLGYRLVQIDDGYQVAVGDWRPNDRFPSGFEALTSEIHRMGLKAGLWLAPFFVEADLPLVAEHPDWFLDDGDGNPIIYDPLKKNWRPLDLTHPEACKFVRSFMTDLKEAGFDFFKIDFLFGGAYEGRHYDPTVTGLAAFRRGMEIVRDAVGPEIELLAVAGPWLASAGQVDSYRQSFDVVFENGWPSWPYFEAAARGTSARYFSHGVLFDSDPDHVIVRPPLSMNEARAAVSYVALTGGLWLVSEDLASLGRDRMALLRHPEVLDIVRAGRSAVPVDLFEEPSLEMILSPMVVDIAEGLGVPIYTGGRTPRLWKLEMSDDSVVVGVFNWDDTAGTTEVRLDGVGLNPNATYRVREIWKGTVEEVSGRITLDQPAHSVDLLVIRPVD